MRHKLQLLTYSYLVINLLAFSPTNTQAMDDDLISDLGINLEEDILDEATSSELISEEYQLDEEPTPKTVNQKTAPIPTQETEKAAPHPETQTSAPKEQPQAQAAPTPTISTEDLVSKLRKGKKFTTEEVEAWIAQTADLNMCLDNGKTMLLYIVANSTNLDALRLLMEYGADVQTHCTPRYEALFIAAINNPSAAMTEMLINNGANLVEKDHEGNTALILAATYNKSSDVINILLEYGLKVKERNKFGFDALTLSAYENGNLLVLQSLLEVFWIITTSANIWKHSVLR